MKTSVYVLLAATGAAVLLGAGVLLSEHTPVPIGTAAAPPAQTPRTALVQQALQAANAHTTAASSPPPASLQGTQVDGEIIIDQQQQLVVTRRLRDLFDYFLSGVGEESLSQVAARVHAYIRARVPEPAQSQALNIFQQYLGYLEALKTLPEVGGSSNSHFDLDAIERQLAAQARLRQQFFAAATIRAFFADDDAFTQQQLRSLRIQQDPSRSLDEKVAALAALNQQLPNDSAAQSALQLQQLEQLTHDWQQRGGSPEELQRLRQGLVGAAAAERLQQLDANQQAFANRIEGYLHDRQQVLQQRNLSEAQREQQLQQLREAQFSASEQLRLSAYEQRGSSRLD